MGRSHQGDHDKLSYFCRWSRSTKEPSFSAWVDCFPEAVGGPVSQSLTVLTDDYSQSLLLVVGFDCRHTRTDCQTWTWARSPSSRRSYSFLGIFFVLPCIESYQKVDLRTITLGVPPQEVLFSSTLRLDKQLLLFCLLFSFCSQLLGFFMTTSKSRARVVLVVFPSINQHRDSHHLITCTTEWLLCI